MYMYNNVKKKESIGRERKIEKESRIERRKEQDRKKLVEAFVCEIRRKCENEKRRMKR